MTSNLKSVANQVEEIRSLISDAQQTLAQANYALSTLLDRLGEEGRPDDPLWSEPGASG